MLWKWQYFFIIQPFSCFVFHLPNLLLTQNRVYPTLFSSLPLPAINNYRFLTDKCYIWHTVINCYIFNFSFGQPCIFLLGGQTLDDLPCAMYLRSGDIIMMSRDARLAYHAVPRILRHQELATLLTQDIECDISSERRRSLQCLEKYLSNSRINVNIRQVEGPSGSFAGQVK